MWGLTELLVTPMPNSAFYELMRQRVEEMRQQQTAPEPVYARGNVEWSRQQAEAHEGSTVSSLAIFVNQLKFADYRLVRISPSIASGRLDLGENRATVGSQNAQVNF